MITGLNGHRPRRVLDNSTNGIYDDWYGQHTVMAGQFDHWPLQILATIIISTDMAYAFLGHFKHKKTVHPVGFFWTI